MSAAMNEISASVLVRTDAQHAGNCLRQLPEAALDLVLQQLVKCSLACTAVTCSALRHVVPAHVSNLEVRCSTTETWDSFSGWFEANSSSLSKTTKCSVAGANTNTPQLGRLQCPELRQLRVQNAKVQLESAAGRPGVLHDCSNLTALDLEFCAVQAAAAAAITKLPELQHLSLARTNDEQRRPLEFDLQHLKQLTHLSLEHGTFRAKGFAMMSQLSVLTNLAHLKLAPLISPGLPGGLPSQLVKLTCLDLEYSSFPDSDLAVQFQHLSSLTALQRLALDAGTLAASDLSGIKQLSQLTALELICVSQLQFTTSSINPWGGLTALKRLALKYCTLQPDTLAKFMQLRSLTLQGFKYSESTSLNDLLDAVSQLSQLTELHVLACGEHQLQQMMPPAAPSAAFAAFTASTNLCSLQLQAGLKRDDAPEDWALFMSDSMHPHLVEVRLHHERHPSVSLSEQQLQQLCNCCPNVQSLSFVACLDPSATAWLPLLQLSSLTYLEVCNVGVATAEALMRAVAQLTKLKQLTLLGNPQLAEMALTHLTSLTALDKLQLQWNSPFLCYIQLQNKARWYNPSDIWVQFRDQLPTLGGLLRRRDLRNNA